MRPVYEGIELAVGWKIVGTETVLEKISGQESNPPKKAVLTNWAERTITESFHDVSTFANDLAESLDHRIEKCITNADFLADFFDIEKIFRLLCGEKLDDGRIKIKEGELEEHGVTEFKLFFKEVCALKHIAELNDERFDSRMYSSVLRDWKGCIRFLVWHKDMTTILLSCLKPLKPVVSEDGNGPNGITSQLKSDFETSLVKMELVPAKKSQLATDDIFLFQFANHAPFQARVNEEEVVRVLYTNELLFTKAGPVAMTSFDIAMSMGGSEAIVESFYSVMDTQKQVRQHHVTLEDRTILDWATSNVLNCEDVVARAAKLYVDGMAEKRLPRHRVGNLKRKSCNSFKASQVLTRLSNEKGRYPFLS